jgi:hypothetical protein
MTTKNIKELNKDIEAHPPKKELNRNPINKKSL